MIQLKEETELAPRKIARLATIIPEVLCSDKAVDNLLAVIDLLRLHGVSDNVLSGAALQHPTLFMVEVTLSFRIDWRPETASRKHLFTAFRVAYAHVSAVPGIC